MGKMKELLKEAKDLFGVSYEEKDFEENVETKANETMHSTNVAFGKEIIPTNVMLDPMLDLLPNYSKFINLFPGNHGTDMPVSAIVPIIGEADLFVGNGEWTGASDIDLTPAKQGPTTWSATITQGQFLLQVNISKRELNYGPEQLEAIVRERINRAAGRTIDAVLVNGDTASSGNVNGTYSSSAYYAQCDNGIRKVGIANTAVTVGTLDAGSYLDVVSVLDEWYQSDLDNLVIVEPSNVYMKTLQLDEVITMDKFGPSATINTGVLAKVWNIDVVTERDFPALTNSAGKVDTTAGNNTTGSFAVVYKPAVQYGFGQPLEIDLFKVPGKGVRLVATMEFGFTIVNGVAGLGKTVGLGVGITL